MKRFHLVVLTLALSSALIYGCAEKKETADKAKEAAGAPVEAIAQKPSEPPVAVPEEAAAVKEQAKEVVRGAEKKAAAAAKAAEVKAIAAEKAVEVKDAVAAKAADVKAAAGAAIYKMKCSPCHGPEAKGTTMAPALKGNAWVMAASTADLTGVIKNGRQGKAKKYPNFLVDMPASKAMAEGDLDGLAAYLKSLN